MAKLLVYLRENGLRATMRRIGIELAICKKLLLRATSFAALAAFPWDLPVQLLVTHSRRGGTERAVQEQITRFENSLQVLVLRSLSSLVRRFTGYSVVLEGPGITRPLRTKDWHTLPDLLKNIPIASITVHHLLDFQQDIRPLLTGAFDVVLHDYTALSDTIHLTDENGRYNGPQPNAVWPVPPHKYELYHWLFNHAGYIFAPSRDVATRIRQGYPTADITVLPHEEQRAEWLKTPLIPPLADNEALRIVILGHLTSHKGRNVLRETIDIAAQDDAPLDFTLIGYTAPALHNTRHGRQTGAYREEELQDMIARVDPHVIWFPATGPETYSYTLTAALMARRPVMAPDIGAFSERVAGRPLSWIVGWDQTPAWFVAEFLRLRPVFLQR